MMPLLAFILFTVGCALTVYTTKISLTAAIAIWGCICGLIMRVWEVRSVVSK